MHKHQVARQSHMLSWQGSEVSFWSRPRKGARPSTLRPDLWNRPRFGALTPFGAEA